MFTDPTDHSFFLTYLEDKKNASEKARLGLADYKRHCCTCNLAEGTPYIKKRQSRVRGDHIFQRKKCIELQMKPKPFVIPTKNSYHFTCQVCHRFNLVECRKHHAAEKAIEDILKATEEGNDGRITILAEYLGIQGINYQQPKSLMSALHFCALVHSEYCAQELIELGATVDILDRENRTPLWQACSLPDRHALVELLLTNGADPNHMNRKGSTCLMASVVARELEYISLLIRHGVNVNKVSPTGETALWKAASLGEMHMVRELLLAGARTDIINSAGVSPLATAQEHRALGHLTGQLEKYCMCIVLLRCTSIDEVVQVDLEDDHNIALEVHLLEEEDELAAMVEQAAAESNSIDSDGMDNREAHSVQCGEKHAEETPEGTWEQRYSSIGSGELVWYNVKTEEELPIEEETTWDSDWEEFTDPNSGALYYYHKVTGQTQWA